MDTGDVKAIAELAQSFNADLTVIGPELPLVRGVVDEFAKARVGDCGAFAGCGRARGQQDFREGIHAAAWDSDGEDAWGIFFARRSGEGARRNFMACGD